MAAESFEDFLEAVREMKKYIKHDLKKVKIQTMKEAATDLQNMFDRCVANFYDSYKPMFYKRTDSLYGAYRITVRNDKLIIDQDAFYMPQTHRVNSDYIYEYVFMRGWHGGAVKGKDHPEPGTPWWRTPPPFLANKYGVEPWYRWGSAAYSSLSPDKQIDDAFEEYKNAGKINDIFDKYFTQIIENKYKIFKFI